MVRIVDPETTQKTPENAQAEASAACTMVLRPSTARVDSAGMGGQFASHAPTRLLVIDDEVGIREMLAFELSAEGFEVTTVPSGRSAVAKLKQESFDAVITDLKMPDMDGLQTLTAIKVIDEEIAVIVATGYATLDTAVACMKAGAYDYIQKPYNVAELIAQVQHAIESRHLRGAVLLCELSRNLLATLKRSDLIQIVLEYGPKLLSADAALLVLGGPAGGTDYYCGDDQTFDMDFGRTMAERTWTCQAGAFQVDAFLEPPMGAQFNAMVVYPLLVGDRRLGSMLLFRTAARPAFRGLEVRLGSIFAAHVAMAFDNARLYGELEHHVATDELTNVYSRRFLFDTLHRELSRATRSADSPTSVLVIDVDHFKQVNDTMGHAAGDEVLRNVAAALRNGVRDYDIVARFGGDEFVVVLPATGMTDAVLVAERLREAIGQLDSRCRETQVTVSIGVAGHDGASSDEISAKNTITDLAERLLRLADRALYRAKDEGRNRICICQSHDDADH